MKSAPKIKAEKSSPPLKGDTKKRRAASKSTSKSNGKHLLIGYEHAPIGIVETTLEGKHLNVNEELCRITGYEKEELLQGGIKDYTHEEDYPIDVKLHGQLVEGKIPFYKLEKRYVRKDGEVVWVELTRSIIRDAEGKPLYTIGIVLDISERKHVERVLRDSSERLRLATETAQMFMWEWDFENQTYTLPDNFTQALGFSTGLSPKNSVETVQRLVPAEDLQSVTDAFKKAFVNQKDLHSLPCRVINPENGQTVWLEVNAKIIYDYEGKPKRMFGVAQNITENKKAQDEIAIISRMPAENPYPILRLTPDGQILYANRPGSSLLELWKQQMHQTIPDELQTHVAEAFASGLKKEIEFNQNGKTFSCTLVPIRESGYVNFYGNDITKRKRAEKALLEKDKQLRHITDVTPVLFSQCSSDLRYLFVNKTAAEFLGFPPEEIAGKPIPEIMGEAAFEAIRPYVDRVLKGERVEYEMEIPYRAAGRRFMYVVYEPERNDRGVVVGWVATVTDITERKRMEQALAESVRQQEALYRLAEQLNRTNSLEDGFVATLDAILDVLQCDRASILLFDHENVMRFVAWRGLSDAYRKATEGHSPWKVDEENPQPIIMNDSRTAGLSDTLRVVIEEEGIRSLAFIPLVSNGKLIGKFMVYFNTPHVFNEAEIELSQTIAHQLAFDIEREHAEEKLRESEERYRVVVESQSEMLCRFRPDGTILFVNDAYARARGITPEELINRNFWEFVAEADRPAVKAMLDSLTPQAPEVQIENRFQTTDGERWTLWTNRALRFDSNGHLLEVQSSGIDITERKQAEEALRQSEERFARFMQHLPGLAWIKDVEGRYVYANAAAEKAFRTPREKLYSKTDQEVFPAEVAAQFKENDERALMDGTGMQVIETLKHNDDVLHYSLVSKFPIPGPDGKTVLIGGTAFDITERLQAEEALRESEERFSAILRQATAGIVRKDAEGRFLFVNEAFCNMLGYTEADLIGKTIWDVTHEDDITENKRLYDRLMLEGIPFKLEKRLIRRDGSTLWVDVSVSPIMDVTGKPQSAVAVEVDITGRKQAEESLHQLNLQLESRVETRTAELQATNKALQESRRRLQILSRRLVDVQEEERRALARELHDRVGQTLAALNINLIIINSQLSPEAAEQISTRLQDSMKLVAETIALVRDVMTDLRPAVLDDYGLEAALESHLVQFMSRYEIKAKLEKPDPSIPHLGPSLEMTFLRIAQEALINIARHAHASEVKLSLRQEQDAITMTVQDNGVGIESWQEANRPGSHGLTIMRERAEAFGGTLQVRAAPGQGTMVEVNIPLKDHREMPESRSL